jgi:hypothetical protein
MSSARKMAISLQVDMEFLSYDKILPGLLNLRPRFLPQLVPRQGRNS